MASRTISVTFLGDASKLKRTFGEVESTASKFKGKLKGIGSSVAGGILGAQAVTGGVRFLGDAMRDAADEQQGIAKLSNVMKNAGVPASVRSSTEDWITKLQNATGVMDDDLRPALAKLVSGGVPLEKAQGLLSDALDVSAAKGIDLQSVIGGMVKGYRGQTGALGKLGIATKDANGKALTFAQIMGNVKKSVGGTAAAAANTAAGKMAILRAKFADLKENIGSALIPILTKLASWVSDKVVPAFEKIAAWVSQHWPQIRDTIVGAVRTVWGYVQPVISALQSLWDRFGGHILEFIRTTFAGIVREIQGAFNIVRGIFNVFAGIFTGDWSKVWDGIKGIFSGVWDVIVGIFTQVWARIKLVFQLAWGVIGGAVSGLWNSLVSTASGAIDSVVSFFQGLPGKIAGFAGDMLTAASSLGGSIVDGILDGLGSAGGAVADFVSEIGSALKGFINDHILGPIRDFHFEISVGPFSKRFQPFGSLPMLAKGGVLDQPTLAVLGDGVGRNRREIATPEALLRDIVRSEGGGRGGITVHVDSPLVADARFATFLADLIARQIRDGGPVGAALKGA